MDKLYKNLSVVREKHYQLGKKHDYEEWENYYQDDLSLLYVMFSKYYTMPYGQFVKIIYETQ
jgi:hypothetical protein